MASFLIQHRRRDPRSAAPVGPRDPRAGMSRQPAPNVAPTMQGPPAASSSTASTPTGPAGGGQWAIGAGTSDAEKVTTNLSMKLRLVLKFSSLWQAALIMQVLQLSDEQIALLPPEQRQSIMVLKEQIARSSR